MRTMVPLRCLAIASNMAFLAYGLPLGLWPVAVLHALLLPLNILRLFQIRRTLANIRLARTSEVEAGPLMSSLALERHAQGTVLFRKGDWGDRAYFIAKGDVDFPEIGARAGVGQLFGEFAIFSPEHTRTASAVCATDAVLYRVDEQAIVSAFHQHPPFAFALMRLIMRRTVDNIARLETRLAQLQREGRGGA